MNALVNRHTPEIKNEIREGEFETIFGINIWSRYNDDSELYEMLKFCKYLNKIGMTEWVDELFYDSKASLCYIRLIGTDSDADCSYEIDAVRIIASLTIEQFELNGIIGHKNPYLSSAITFQI
ncbi:hypothetical protein [Acinetobacter sp. 243_ASPC]|uniref:hypothetical protein n=1 Tax=Acinetobacter sp. 243_ASPC TaxID=1579345 RepID=UPI00066094CD|nr:hypothetical protein [Acinetobacter sp. 243_ASPC]